MTSKAQGSVTEEKTRGTKEKAGRNEGVLDMIHFTGLWASITQCSYGLHRAGPVTTPEETGKVIVRPQHTLKDSGQLKDTRDGMSFSSVA